jgi:hypothetical protein
MKTLITVFLLSVFSMFAYNEDFNISTSIQADGVHISWNRGILDTVTGSPFAYYHVYAAVNDWHPLSPDGVIAWYSGDRKLDIEAHGAIRVIRYDSAGKTDKNPNYTIVHNCWQHQKIDTIKTNIIDSTGNVIDSSYSYSSIMYYIIIPWSKLGNVPLPEPASKFIKCDLLTNVIHYYSICPTSVLDDDTSDVITTLIGRFTINGQQINEIPSGAYLEIWQTESGKFICKKLFK